MATDLVSHITPLLTRETVQKLASGFDANPGLVEAALEAAVPALLAGFAAAAAEGRAQALADAIHQQLPEQPEAGLAEAESRRTLLGALLGPNKLTAIAASVAKYSGLGQSAATVLVGALTPMVLGAAGKAAGTADAAGLARLFEAQRGNIADALPSRLTSLLQGSEVLAALHAQPEIPVAPAAAAGAAKRGGTGSLRWLYWLVPLVVLAGAVWFVMRPHPAPAGNTDSASMTMDLRGSLGAETAGVNPGA